MERKMFDTPVLPRLETILAEVASGDLVIPDFQRPFVWGEEQRLNLLDSILKGMPIGSLLVWRSRKWKLKTLDKIADFRTVAPLAETGKYNYLLDGHQRLSTLFGALHVGHHEARLSNSGIWPIYYDLGTKERPAFRPPPRGSPPPHWLPLDIVFDGDKLFEFTQRLRESGLREHAKEAERLANVFRDYIIPIVPLVTEELDTVTDAFVRINSQGSAMSEADMLRALTFLSNVDTGVGFERVRGRLVDTGWSTIPDQVLVNVLKAQLGLDVYASSVRGVRDRLNEDPLALERLQASLLEAVEFLDEIGVSGFGSLPYAYQLVTLAALAAESPGFLLNSAHFPMLREWFWQTTYTEHFTGITGNRIRSGIRDLFDLGGASWAFIEYGVRAVRPLTQLRMSSVRTRAFLLFLSQQPADRAAARRRQQLLSLGDAQLVPALLPRWEQSDPGNRVIATPEELRVLRRALREKAVDQEMADEWSIPPSAVRALPDEHEFLRLRREWLLTNEFTFMSMFNLRLGGEPWSDAPLPS